MSGHRRAGDLFCCFGCRIAHEVALPAAVLTESEANGGAPLDRPRPNTLLLRLGLGIFLAINIMVSSWFFYSQEVFGDVARAEGAYASLIDLFSYLAFFLATLVVALLGLPLVADVLDRLRAGEITTHLLIAVGVFSAYLLSALHTFWGEGRLYYDTAAVVLVVVTLGSYLEAGAKRRASEAAGEILAALPRKVEVRRDDTVTEIGVDEIRPGDRVRILPGGAIPVDGRLSEGQGHVDEASLTGESRPRRVRMGDRLLSGTVSLDGQLWIEAEKVGEDTVLALVERSLAEARAGKPPIQRLADRVASVFVPAVVVLALGVFVHRIVQGDTAAGVLDGLSVLLISCPCALGLAAPLASWHGLRRAAECGILVDSSATLERAAAVRRVFFDKTGTLTQPELALDQVWAAPGLEPERVIAWAASLESASSHPIARALFEEAVARGISWRIPQAARNVPGLGVEGRVEGRQLRLGSACWLDAAVEPAKGARSQDRDESAIFLMDDERVLARFDLEERLRPGAAEVVLELHRQGMEVAVLSGDRNEPTRRLAERLRIPSEGELLPADKVRRLAASRPTRLAMVGDGLNDAPVLASADVGIALGSASDLARRSGNVRLLTDRLERVPQFFSMARDTRWRIRINLLWAFTFNSVGIALATMGRLTPVFAAVAMVLSSLVVVRISSRAGISQTTLLEMPDTAGAARPAVDPRLALG